ncbi:MAG: hypothetical protein WBW99_17650 [Pseudolabrys sp.]
MEIVFLHRDGIEIGNVSIDGHEIIRQIHGDPNLFLVTLLLDKLAISSASTSRRREEGNTSR